MSPRRKFWEGGVLLLAGLGAGMLIAYGYSAAGDVMFGGVAAIWATTCHWGEP